MGRFDYRKLNQISYRGSFIKKEGFRKFRVYDEYWANSWDGENMGLGDTILVSRSRILKEYEAINRLAEIKSEKIAVLPNAK